MPEAKSAEQKAFGRELKRAREAAGLTQKDAALHVGMGDTTLSHYERGARRIPDETVVQLDDLYGQKGTLARKWRDIHQGAALAPWFEEISEREASAVELRDYQPLVVPGLVQTAEYARAVVRDSWPSWSLEKVDRLVASRMRRQHLLEAPDRPLIFMVIEESVVHRRVGALSAEQHREQIQRLIHEIEGDTLRMQIVPATASRHHGASGPFRVYTYADHPSFVSAEYMTSEAQISDPQMVLHCTTLFGLLQGEALNADDSLGLLKEAMA